MRATSFKPTFLLATIFILTSTAAAQEAVQYELKFGRPNTHLLEITIRATGLRGGPVAEFALPAWAPGWYIINDYAKNVQEFQAQDAAGQPLPWKKTDKQTWSVTVGTGTAAIVRYKLYGNTLGVDWTQYNDKHAHIAGPATWMYLVGGKQRPVRLAIDVPQGWRVATGMEPAGEGKFAVADYDTFIDAPVEISDYAEKTFTAGGATFHIVVHDVIGRKDFSGFAEKAQKVVEKQVMMMAPAAGSGGRATPYEHYYFLFHNWPQTGGGLEHLNSTQIFLSSDWDCGTATEPAGPACDGQLGVTSHEFFHAWNVKRIRPKPLGPFDYSREVYTPSLWISEGLTSYYGQLTLMRAGLITPEQYLLRMGQLITYFENLPGRKERSIEDTSWDTWFWYRGDSGGQSNQANTDHCYYDGGQIMGHVLDFAIRQATNNQKSLDDWMRLMYTRYALPKPGFTPEDAVRAASDVAATDMSDFFRRHISGKERPAYETYFAYAGIRVEEKVDSRKAWLGADFRRADARVSNVALGGPADLAGLDRGDVVVAVNGRAVTAAEVARALEGRKPGDSVKLTVNHLGELKDISVTLGSDPTVTYTLKLMENPSEQQKKIYEGWIGK